MRTTFLLSSALLSGFTAAFPWAAKLVSDGSGLTNEALFSPLDKRAGSCPVHATRKGAAPYSSYYPSLYTSAMNGKPGTGRGGVLVPAPGDSAHAYVAPGPNDIRGPW